MMKSANRPRLGVNIDHVATLRQARGEFYPRMVEAARTVIAAGADQITVHLREDRRHAQDRDIFDLRAVCSEYSIPLNLEMGCNESVLTTALQSRPDWICLVPENRQERTTEGGLDLATPGNFQRVQEFCLRLKEGIPNVKISLFLECDLELLRSQFPQIACDAVEIHTGEYAKHFLEHRYEAAQNACAQFAQAAPLIAAMARGYHCGHGLTYESAFALVRLGHFQEYNIGHWIISQALFEGLFDVVRRLRGLMDDGHC